MNKSFRHRGLSLARVVPFGLLALGGAALLVSRLAAQAPATVAVPQFTYEKTFVKGTLPNGWIMGFIGGIQIDSRDHVWVLTRPMQQPVEKQPKAAPPVIELDPNGNFVQAWGGPSKTGEYEWPAREHAFGLDPAGFLWISGNAGEGSGAMKKPDDDVLLKFTLNGKFVKQFGKQNASKGNADTNNVKEATAAQYYKKEMYVSDGYGNSRVIVFDADTMAFKRMWGAFGKPPKDVPHPTPPYTGGWDPGPDQYYLPHSIVVTKDDKVYVADRPNRRIQVFTLEGKYLNQLVIPGAKRGFGGTGALALSADKDQQFLYVGDSDAPPTKSIIVVDRKTMKVISRFGDPDTKNVHSLAVDSKGNIYVGEPLISGSILPRHVYKGTVQKAPSAE